MADTDLIGDVTGTLDLSGSPYIVTGDVNVPASGQLIIEAGVEVLFAGHYKFNVYGTLKAQGHPEAYILFSRNQETDESRGWGIRFEDSNNANVLSYCIIENGYADNGIVDGSYDDRGAGVFINGSMVTIEDSIIRDNEASTGAGIFVGYNCHTTIRRNIIANNKAVNSSYNACGGGGINVEDYSGNNRIENNFIYKNSYSGNVQNYEGGGGISLAFGQTVVINNTITGNTAAKGSGIHTSRSYDGLVKNNIVYGNTGSANGEQISVETGYTPGTVPAGLDIQFNDIKKGGSTTGIVVVYRNTFQDDFTGTDNIDEAPLFVDPAMDDYHIRGGSLVIDAGDDADAPPDDFDGEARPQGAGFDMGADEYAAKGQSHIIPMLQLLLLSN